ncbi:LysR substrate binding domain-containing protein [Epibacterium ulvae]|nr:LysR substrate binding domain-containing protein [Epibacterium ulvae]
MDTKTQEARLKDSKISAHSFLNNPIDEHLEIHLLEENAEVSQGNVESTAYLTLAGTHVGLIPNHYAEHWVSAGKLIPVASELYQVISQIHAVRLRSGTRNDVAAHIWDRLKSLSAK